MSTFYIFNSFIFGNLFKNWNAIQCSMLREVLLKILFKFFDIGNLAQRPHTESGCQTHNL